MEPSLSIVTSPWGGVLFEPVRRLSRYRDLLQFLVVSDIKRTHADTVLGHLWWLLDPLLTMLTYVLLVSFIFKRGEPNYPVFVLSAIIPWQGFSGSVVQAATAITSEERLIKQVPFPKGVLVVAGVVSNLFQMLCGFLVVILSMLCYRLAFSWALLSLPLLIVIQTAFTLGLSFWAAVVGVHFRDLSRILAFVLRVWFLLSPGLFSIRHIPPRLLPLYWLNPFTGLFEAYHAVILHGQWPHPTPLLVAAGVSFVTLLGGFWWFAAKESQLVRHL